MVSCNTNDLQLYSMKYFHLIQIIFFAYGLIEMDLSRYIWPINGILRDTMILSQGRPGSNGNEEVLHTSQISKFGPELMNLNSVSIHQNMISEHLCIFAID